MTEQCPIPHDNKSVTGEKPIFFSPHSALQRFHRGEHPIEIFVHSKGKVTMGDLAVQSLAMQDRSFVSDHERKDRINTLYAAGATDVAARMAIAPLAHPQDIVELKTSSLPFDPFSTVGSIEMEDVILPLVRFITLEEAGDIIDDWKAHPTSRDQADSIIDKLTSKSDATHSKTPRQYIAEVLRHNLSTGKDMLTDYYPALVSIYAQQIGMVDQEYANQYPLPSITTFQGMAQESAGILMSQAARSDKYHEIADVLVPLLNTDYDTENETVRLLLRKRPNGRLRVVINPTTRKEIEERFDREQRPDELITGCAAMPLIQTMLERVDNYLEAFKAA